MLRVSFHSHKNSVRHQSSLQTRKPRHKEFRIWLQIISLITGATRVFSQSSLLPQLPVCLHRPHFPHSSLIPGPEGERVLLWGNASTMVASTWPVRFLSQSECMSHVYPTWKARIWPAALAQIPRGGQGSNGGPGVLLLKEGVEDSEFRASYRDVEGPPDDLGGSSQEGQCFSSPENKPARLRYKGLQKTTGSNRTSLVVQWLKRHAPNAGRQGSIPGQGTRLHIPQLRVHMLQLKILHITMKTDDFK